MIVLSKIGDELDFRFGPDSPSEPEIAGFTQSAHAHDPSTWLYGYCVRLTISRIFAPPSPSPAHYYYSIYYNGNAHIWDLYSAQAAHDRV